MGVLLPSTVTVDRATGADAPLAVVRRSAPLPVHLLGAGLLLCALVLMPGSLGGAEQFALPKELVLSLSAFAALVVCLQTYRPVALDAADLSLALFVGISLASAMVAAENGWLAARALGLTAGGAAVFWAARSAAREGGSGAGVAWVAVILPAAAVGGLLEAYGATYGLSVAGRGPGGTLGNRNILAHLLALGLPAYLLCVARARERRAFALLLLGLVPVTTALTLTRCRAAWLAAGVMLAVFAATRWAVARSGAGEPMERGRAALLALGVIVGISLAVVLPNRLDWVSRSPYLDTVRQVVDHRTGSGRARLVQYGNTLQMVRANPLLGVGPGNWAVQYPRYAPVDSPVGTEPPGPVNRLPSSDWVGIAAESGLPALLVLMLGGLLLGRAAWRRCMEGEFDAGAALLCTLVAVAVLGSVDNVLARPAPAFMAWLALGVLAPAAVPGTRPWRLVASRLAAGIAVGLLGVALAVPAVGRLYARHLYETAGYDVERMERAARVNPGDYEARLHLAFQWTQMRECDRARPHVEAARRLYPHNLEAQRLLLACRLSEPSAHEGRSP